jgi:hypothetical protein
MRHFSIAMLAAASTVAFTQIALAADLPAKAPLLLPAAISSSSGPYFWADGAYESVRLPTYSLGAQSANPAAPLVLLGPVQSYDPRAAGASFSGGIGYVFPHGTFWGDRFRVELNARFIHATDSQSGRDLETLIYRSNLFGSAVSTGGPGFLVLSKLSTEYQSWQTGLMAATDYRFGAVLLTPSITVFGGRSYIEQDFSEVLADLAGNPSGVESYAATSALRWTDWGAKLGIDARTDVTSGLGIGLKGSVGIADRHVNLSANDTPGFILAIFFPPAAIDTDANTVPFLANAEASIFLKSPSSNATLRVFAGLNYDSRVPGISAPVINPAVTGVPGTPAGIKFEGDTSYYVGGGLTVKFGGP